MTFQGQNFPNLRQHYRHTKLRTIQIRFLPNFKPDDKFSLICFMTDFKLLILFNSSDVLSAQELISIHHLTTEF